MGNKPMFQNQVRFQPASNNGQMSQNNMAQIRGQSMQQRQPQPTMINKAALAQQTGNPQMQQAPTMLQGQISGVRQPLNSNLSQGAMAKPQQQQLSSMQH